MRRLARLLVPFALSLALLPGAHAVAMPFPVTSTADGSEAGTLRWAVAEANSRPGADSIPIGATGTIQLGSALPAIEGDLAIVGPGADALTIRRGSADAFRILEFSSDTAFLSGLTVSNGVAEEGGGIFNGSGSLTLTRVVLSGNEARAEGGIAVARGGGVASFGPLTVLESTIAGNAAIAERGASQTLASGGGLNVFANLTLERSTVSGNAVRAVSAGGNPGVAEGGGAKGVRIDIVSATIAGNESTSDAVARSANLEATAAGVIRDTIVADPRGEVGSCSAPLTSDGFNLDEDSSCGFEAGTDLREVEALLGPLAANGGPTPTHALLAGSAAIDRGHSFGSTSDQRGLPRPVDFLSASNTEGGDGSDIGAFELQPPPRASQPLPAPPLRVSQVSGDHTPPQTRIVSGPARAGFERLAEFRFTSTEAQSRFQCKVDKRRWRGCASPFQRRVGAGRGAGRKHVFKVRAVDRFGNADPTPARFGWRVKKVVG